MLVDANEIFIYIHSVHVSLIALTSNPLKDPSTFAFESNQIDFNSLPN